MPDLQGTTAPSLAFTIDLGGTHLRAAVVDESGKVHYRLKRKTPDTNNLDQLMKDLVAAARECEQKATQDGATIRLASVVVPGTVDAANEVIIQCPNVPCLDGFALKAALQSELGWRVILENDANAAAMGEMWLGAGRGYRGVICVTLGTGVGGGIIIDGKLLRGVDGQAGEIGHATVEPFGGLKCKCGNTGCLEMFASATAIVRMTREALPHYPQSGLGDSKELYAEKIYDAGIKGDPLAIEVLKRMGTYLGIAMANLVNLINPEIIVIGGGVANAWKLFATYTEQQIRERAFPLPAQRVKLVAAQCGDDAGLLGAARLAFDA